MSTVVWVDASSGASGDMLLGALLGAGVPLEVMKACVDAVAPQPVTLRVEQVQRNGFAATRCHVLLSESHHHRTWRDIKAMLIAADLPFPVRELATRVFERLALAEGVVHGHPPEEVHFHEVGALDAIVDIVGACAGFAWLVAGAGPAEPTPRAGGKRARHVAPPAAEVVVSPVAVGSGAVRGAHGGLPVPPPAVAELLRGAPSYAGPPGSPAHELCTPTGAALLTALATGWGAQPTMTTSAIGVGAGKRDPAGHANVLRLLVGTPVELEPGPAPHPADPGSEAQLLLETNVDDLDPRVWPAVIASLLSAGAADAWLTPILMKTGRPAHTLSVLVDTARAPVVRSAVFRETSTIGLREQVIAKRALAREEVRVTVGGQPVAVKLALLDGAVVNAQPEYDDVARVAATLGRPVADVLADAAAACRTFVSGPVTVPSPSPNGTAHKH